MRLSDGRVSQAVGTGSKKALNENMVLCSRDDETGEPEWSQEKKWERQVVVSEATEAVGGIALWTSELSLIMSSLLEDGIMM